LLDGWIAQGHEAVSLGGYMEAMEFSNLPRHEAESGALPGRNGELARQGREFLADAKIPPPLVERRASVAGFGTAAIRRLHSPRDSVTMLRRNGNPVGWPQGSRFRSGFDRERDVQISSCARQRTGPLLLPERQHARLHHRGRAISRPARGIREAGLRR